MSRTSTTARRARALDRRTESNSITQRQLDASRRELYSMTSEIDHYGDQFSGPQLLAMRDVMRALRNLIATLED